MDSNSPSLKKWFWGFKLQHFCACLIDLSLWLAFLALLQMILNRAFVFEKQSTVTLLHLIGLALLTDRLMSLWPFHLIWPLIQKNDPNSKGKVASDLLQNKGYFPNPELHKKAIEQFSSHNVLPAYPWLATSLRHSLRSLLWIVGMTPIIAIDQYQPPTPQSHQIVIKVTPPDYLKKETWTLELGQSELEVFPGTLLSINIPKNLNIDKIKDQRGRLYLPRTEEFYTNFDIRIMGNVQFSTMTSELLKVTTLMDEHPTVTWVNPPEKLDFAELECQFLALDDFGIKETLITVNDSELEYAGDPMGRESFDYHWTFNPNEHIPLMGGNIRLQITVYDNDTIQGPKYTRSKALVWEFPGIEAITKASLDLLDDLIKDNSERLAQQKEAPTADELQNQMEKFSDSLKSNPALSQEISPIMDQLLNDYRELTQAPQPSPQEPNLLNGEKEQLKRNADYYKFFRSALDNILQTIQKAEMVSDLVKAAEQSRQNNPPPVDFFKDMFEKISEMTSKGALTQQQGDQLMDQINQADIASALGEKNLAADLLEKTANDLRQSEQGSPQDNPLAKKFQELMQTLSELIQAQSKTLSDLTQTNQKSLSELQKWREAIAQQKQTSLQSEAFKEYQTTAQSFQDPKLSDDQKQELLSKLGNPDELSFQGRRLTEMMRHMDAFAARPDQKEKYQPQLQALNESLPESMKWPEALFEGPKMNHTEDLKSLSESQQEIAPKGQNFSEEFESNFRPVMPSDGLFRLAEQAAQAAKQAGEELLSQTGRAQINMQQAQQRWETLQKLLQQMQQQGEGQGASGQNQPRLSIGKNGQLQLQNQDMLGNREGEGPFQHRKEDMEIALPEDFQNTRVIEDRLKKELMNTPIGSQRDQFQEYMLDLLE